MAWVQFLACFFSGEETLELQLQQLESQLEAALKAPAPELPKVEERKSVSVLQIDYQAQFLKQPFHWRFQGLLACSAAVWLDQ